MRGAVVIVVLFVLAGVARAGPEEDPGAEIAALLRRVEDSDLGYRERAERFRPEFEAFAERHAGTEEALTAELWLLRQCWWRRASGKMTEEAGKMADAILAAHPRSPQLAELCEMAYLFDREQRERYDEQLLATSPHATVQASALLALARMERVVGDPEVRKRGNARLERLRDEFAEVPYRRTTFGEMARAYLEPLDPAALRAGKPVPEIEGRTLDGKPMRLSDYRGKVILLDFWGGW
jgi:hypothetical protein